jgi:hypothetical protein
MKLTTLTPAEAQAIADAYNASHPNDACAKRFDSWENSERFARLSDVVAWFREATTAQRAAVMKAEAVSGWFQSDDDTDPDQDEDGDFVSTPCYCSAFDGVETLCEFLDDASRCGLLFVDAAHFANA